MCGISVIINKSNLVVDQEAITDMTNQVAHRGPDGEGYYHGPNFAFGHRRLAIIDTSERGLQPMSYLDRYVIVYNGEIYNYLELKAELQAEGYRFNNHTDTEVIMAAFDRWGTDCVIRFNGMWAFALYDNDKEIIFCSRDRFGVKPFYYMNMGDLFVSGSEIKQFTVLNKWRAVGNLERIIDFITYGTFDHTEETMFQGVYQLLGGHMLTYDLKTHLYTINKYYDINDKTTLNASNKNILSSSLENKDYLFKIFKDSVNLRLRSDVRVGSCLSGGLDSSSIVCTVNDILRGKRLEEKQITISSCSDNKKYDEQEYIDEVQRFTGAENYKVFPTFEQLISIMDQITWHQDEPFGSASIFAQWCVFSKAREKEIPVMLDGQGADEQLAGYDGLAEVYLAELLGKGRYLEYAKEIKATSSMKRYAGKELLRIILKSITPLFIKNKLKVLYILRHYHWLNKSIKLKDSIPRLNKYSLRNIAVEQIKYSSLPMLLHYEDRNSMAHGIEARVPFLDYRLVEYTLQLPSECKMFKGYSKRILRDAMSGRVPEKIKNRTDKMGFVTAEEIWIRENSEWFKNELIEVSQKIPAFIDQKKLFEWYELVLASNNPINHTIWRLVSLNRWMKVFNVTILK